MRQFTTRGIILSRTDFGEADRIITFLTTDHGKVKAIAKGVRKAKAKLAGSIELFSVADITLILGRRDIDTLISARLVKHYGNIVKDAKRTNPAYELIRLINKNTEEKPEPSYFELLDKSLQALDDLKIDTATTELWFELHLLKLSGHAPNLQTTSDGQKLVPDKKYDFDMGRMCFVDSGSGIFDSAAIKLLRLGVLADSPKLLSRVKDASQVETKCLRLAGDIVNTSLTS